MQFSEYIQQGNRLLRCGYTTGSCATLAVKASACMLLKQELVSTISIVTPKGVEVVTDVLEVDFSKDYVTCAIRKDAGDDIDATDGMLIFATVKLVLGETSITGGVGIGMVTKKGLNQPVGKHAINSSPRKMIMDELISLANEFGYTGGFEVVIFAPTGVELAKKTFNENLGIVGGISIIGTTGIVEPMSLQALLDTIKIEVNIHVTSKQTRLLLTFGNYGQNFIEENNFYVLNSLPQVKISNFVGETLDLIYHTDIEQVMLVGHIGKVVKLAGGVMNTHSKYADCRVEIFSAYAGLHGASQASIIQLMQSATADACIDILDEIGLREVVLEDIISSATSHIQKRIENKFKVGIITFSNTHGLLVTSEIASELLNIWKEE